MSLQARTRPSFQAELDLRTAADKLMEERRKKCCICSLKRPPEERRLAIVFFFSRLPREGMCIYTHNRYVRGCVYSTIVSSIMCILAND